MGEADFKAFIGMPNRLVILAGNFDTEENFSPVLIPTLSKVMDEQLKLAHKVVDVVNRADRKFCVTLLRYSVEKLEDSFA